jgi:hypothetical protein
VRRVPHLRTGRGAGRMRFNQASVWHGRVGHGAVSRCRAHHRRQSGRGLRAIRCGDVRTGSPGGAIAARSGDSLGLQALQRTGLSHLRHVDVLARVGRLHDLKLGTCITSRSAFPNRWSPGALLPLLMAGLCAASLSESVTLCDRLRHDLRAVASPLAPATARLAYWLGSSAARSSPWPRTSSRQMSHRAPG